MKGGGAWEGLRSALDKAAQLGSQAGAYAVSSARELSQKVAAEVAGARVLVDYSVQEQVASAGPGGVWRIYIARSRRQGETGS